MKVLEWPQHFSNYKYMEIFPDTSLQYCRIWPNFVLARNLVIVLVTYKNEEDTITDKGARVATTLYAQGQLNP